jgi:hypothetical protein
MALFYLPQLRSVWTDMGGARGAPLLTWGLDGRFLGRDALCLLVVQDVPWDLPPGPMRSDVPWCWGQRLSARTHSPPTKQDRYRQPAAAKAGRSHQLAGLLRRLHLRRCDVVGSPSARVPQRPTHCCAGDGLGRIDVATSRALLSELQPSATSGRSIADFARPLRPIAINTFILHCAAARR